MVIVAATLLLGGMAVFLTTAQRDGGAVTKSSPPTGVGFVSKTGDRFACVRSTAYLLLENNKCAKPDNLYSGMLFVQINLSEARNLSYGGSLGASLDGKKRLRIYPTNQPLLAKYGIVLDNLRKP